MAMESKKSFSRHLEHVYRLRERVSFERRDQSYWRQEQADGWSKKTNQNS